EEARRDFTVSAWRAGLAGGRQAVSAEPFSRSRHYPSRTVGNLAASDCETDFIAARASRGGEVRGDRQAVADWGADGAAAHALEGRISFLHRANPGYRNAILASVDERSCGCFAQERAAG